MENRFLDKIQKHMVKEEKLLWSGKPNYRKIFNVRDIFFIPFTIVFAIFIITNFTNKTKGLNIFNFVIYLVALYMVIGRFIAKIYYKRKILYAVTDKRILIIIVGKHERIITKYINNLSNIDISTSKNGNGTITFGDASLFNTFYSNTFITPPWNRHNFEDTVFYDISDARKVYELVENLKK